MQDRLSNKLNLTLTDRLNLAADLRRSVKECKDRGLHAASQWAAELLMAMPTDVRSSSARRPALPFQTSTPRLSHAHPFPPISLASPSTSTLGSPHPAFPRNSRVSLGDHMTGPAQSPFAGGWERDLPGEDETIEEDVFELGRSYFEGKELERCARVLSGCRSKKASFLRFYSMYLSADKKAQENLPHFLDSKEERQSIIPHIYPLLEQIENETDPYILYLKGILYHRLGQKDRAMESFISSLRGAPYNWSCWLSIASCISSADEFVAVEQILPRGVMLSFFAITVMLDLHSATELMMSTINELEGTFPTSVHLKACKALVLYHMREFEEAEKAFDSVRSIDPYRLEEIEIYSNMLYVMNRKAKLGRLAHEYAEIDKNRAEVCCLIGNYYSAREEHTKAIQYFKRSLQLNRDYLPAWTLMGHEFVELKNSHAAIEAYRRAIDVNPKDYRAWYGLGQTYELLDMHFYAVRYYNRATALRPYDCRMWTALATVYEHLKKLPESIQSNNRALLGADTPQTITILAKLSQLHDNCRNYKEASSAHSRLIQIGEREHHNITELAVSYLYVAEYELNILHRDQGQLDGGAGAQGAGVNGDKELARRYLEKLATSNAKEKERAEEDLRYLRGRGEGV